MRSKIFVSILFIISLAGSLYSQTYNSNFISGPHFYAGIVTGYNGGFGLQLSGTISNFAKNFPLSARFGIGYTSTDPGKPADARKIFINNATNGIPEEQWLVLGFKDGFAVQYKVILTAENLFICRCSLLNVYG